MTDLVQIENVEALTTEAETLIQGGLELCEEAYSANTRRAYASDWRAFTEFCEEFKANPLQASHATVFAYAQHLATKNDCEIKASTIERRLAGVRHVHLREYPEDTPPTDHYKTRQLLRAIKRSRNEQTSNKKRALFSSDVASMIDHCDTTTTGLRDRALLLLGLLGGFRRSELVALRWCDIETLPTNDEGFLVRVRQSKTDQTGKGKTKAIHHQAEPYCAWSALVEYRNAVDRSFDERALKRSPDSCVFLKVSRWGSVSQTPLKPASVALVIKKRAKAAGLDPALFSGHSLRSGLITEGLARGIALSDLADQAGHAKLDTTRSYDQGITGLNRGITKGWFEGGV